MGYALKWSLLKHQKISDGDGARKQHISEALFFCIFNLCDNIFVLCKKSSIVSGISSRRSPSGFVHSDLIVCESPKPTFNE